MTPLAILFCRLGPYHLARLRAVAGMFNVTAIEYFGIDSTYDWDVIHEADGFRRTTLFSRDDFDGCSRDKFMAKIGAALSEARPEVVAIPGWGERCSRGALFWCKRNNIPVVIMSDSLEWTLKRPRWKEFIKRQLVSTVSAGLAAGKQHREYLQTLGLPGERIFLGFDAVDNDYFIEEARKVRNDADAVRKRYQLPSRYFLASSRFVDKKNLPRLIEAYARYRKLAFELSTFNSQLSTEPWDLVLLGDGPLRETLNFQLSTFSLHNSVHLPGFKQYGELPAYYALASAFVMPSLSETWSLAVNEAMACSLPVIVSSRCGCASELVHEGSNGFIFDPCNIEELARLMVKISAFNFPLSELGAASLKIIANWGTDRFASSLQSAVTTALNVGPRDGTLAGRCLLNLLIGR